ncbi:MAG: NACHT domain-containing protein, partial [Kiloniellales bacterium]
MAAKQSSEGLDDAVIDFYDSLFDRIFSVPFRARIADRLKAKAVLRQVEESADAASQSLIRLFQNVRLDSQVVTGILGGFAPLADRIALDDIANPNVTPEELVDSVIADLPCPDSVGRAGHDAVYRVALHTILQVLMLIGPVMAEWRKLSFASTFEMPRRVVNRLNRISTQLDALGEAGREAADERYGLSYRDYLLQRFFRVEAGTVRMTTNLSVDLRELFVMPRVRPRVRPGGRSAGDGDEAAQAIDLMDLAAAREAFGARGPGPVGRKVKKADDETGESAVEYVKRTARCALVGLPGAGKSTFLEWFQLQLAAVEEELVLGEVQAIPLLLRVRQLDPERLPTGAALIAAATASQDRATLMPAGWIERQMQAGRVIFMLDGLDETDPDLLETRVLPWLEGLLRRYPRCHYLISSRPVGYTPGRLQPLEFEECDLLDFEAPQIRDYARHWCTAVRLAQNEPEAEARREGAADGDRIVAGFADQPYIHDLARNPLMLSAICLVNYFEGGELPQDRALLYRLCVEGLLHNWDQARGIRSEFTLDE